MTLKELKEQCLKSYYQDPEAIILQLIQRCEKLSEALGQVRTMTDDCYYMSRTAASIFDNHCKKALSLYGSEVPLK